MGNNPRQGCVIPDQNDAPSTSDARNQAVNSHDPKVSIGNFDPVLGQRRASFGQWNRGNFSIFLAQVIVSNEIWRPMSALRVADIFLKPANFPVAPAPMLHIIPTCVAPSPSACALTWSPPFLIGRQTSQVGRVLFCLNFKHIIPLHNEVKGISTLRTDFKKTQTHAKL